MSAGRAPHFAKARKMRTWNAAFSLFGVTEVVVGVLAIEQDRFGLWHCQCRSKVASLRESFRIGTIKYRRKWRRGRGPSINATSCAGKRIKLEQEICRGQPVDTSGDRCVLNHNFRTGRFQTFYADQKNTSTLGYLRNLEVPCVEGGGCALQFLFSLAPWNI